MFLLLIVATLQSNAASLSDELASMMLKTPQPDAFPANSYHVAMSNKGRVQGQLLYEYAQPRSDCFGGHYNNLKTKPARGVTVQLLKGKSTTVLETVQTDASGGFSFDKKIKRGKKVRVRAIAELKQNGTPAWNVEVRNNTDTSTPVISQRPIYAYESKPFKVKRKRTKKTITIPTGWSPSANRYTEVRAAAPFAILDTVYEAMQFTINTNTLTSFPPLDIFWSTQNNVRFGNIGSGNIGSTSYISTEFDLFPQATIVVLGDENSDVDEFDAHVIAHEWGHYLEDSAFRSDSIGGPHALGEILDSRLAFSEGFANAISAMILDDPMYCDTGRPGVREGFGFNIESAEAGTAGWYNETSIMTLFYDLFDNNNDGSDNSSLGFQTLYQALSGEHRTVAGFANIFSFGAALFPIVNSQQQQFVASQFERVAINPNGINFLATTENNNADNRDVLPLYTTIHVDDSPQELCVNDDFDFFRDGNKLAQYRYLEIDIPSQGNYQLQVTAVTNTGAAASDPDIVLTAQGEVLALGFSPNPNVENLVVFLEAGKYYATINDFRYQDLMTPSSYPSQVCFNVTIQNTVGEGL